MMAQRQAQQATGASPNALHEAMSNIRSALGVVAVFSLVINILMLTTPIYMLQVYDRVLGSGQIETSDISHFDGRDRHSCNGGARHSSQFGHCAHWRLAE